MSQLSNLLSMYMLLQGRSMMKVKELAEIIEVSERTIKGYKNEFEKAGIYIGTKPGRYGGYYLENTLNIGNLAITNEEIEALKMANEIIRSGNHVFSLDFEKFTSKIINNKNNFENVEFFTKENIRPIFMKEKEKENWNIIKKAHINKNKLNIDYEAISVEEGKNEYSHRKVQPYGTFSHDGSAYMFAYCELRKGIRYFKLSRIQSIEILKENFKINPKYDIKRELRKSFGIIDDAEFYLHLIIKYPMSQLVKEKQFTIEQKITEIENDAIIYEATLKGYREVKNWVLSMGSFVEVIEPIQLKEDIIREIRSLKEIYIGTP